ncbi:hypothetical protein OG216_02120 [Streptomycetaceae bacterium NBC_01309]
MGRTARPRRIEDVDWTSLTRAYGAADDVPDRIAALRSPDRATRDQAYAALHGSVFHQGTRGDAGLTAWAERGMSSADEPVEWAAAFVLAHLGEGAALVAAVAVLQARIARDADTPEEDGPVSDDEAAAWVPYLGGDLAGLAMAALELLGVDGGDACA